MGAGEEVKEARVREQSNLGVGEMSVEDWKRKETETRAGVVGNLS